ncbi:alcohol dehydrogenase catalytic domain-containing protein [Streptomyces minutiscleroticus]|uniref:L-idonate 5-dehydrogenase n=1 Tax=Streptomyces minutiscleroticus TaxID=68238 RepID=A0A918U6T6_9ACTN|nr:alcohol dehydrogenase catalytic domain-containing protein [Streptomyces minutiscleroticus]GGX99566.1 L-idonate 5-dehydrogenase [Streptomyces minutiscleroticus]
MRVTLEEGRALLRSSPPPRPAGASSVLVDIELAGLCRSDLKEVAGARHGPSQFGHELVGRVRTSTVAGLTEGTRVVLDPNVRVDRGTGFADRMWAAGPPALLRQALQPVPDGLPARRLVFAEPLACAVHCLRVAGRRAGDLAGAAVTVLGAGTAGVLIAALARRAGARVTLGNRGHERVAAVRRTGVAGTDVHAFDRLPDRSADVVVAATSFVVPAVLDVARRILAPGGLLVLYGGTAPGDRHPGLDCDLDALRRSESVSALSWQGRPVRVAGSYGTAEEDFDAVVRLLSDREDPLAAEALVSAEVDLEGLVSLLSAAAPLPPGKVLVHPDPR